MSMSPIEIAACVLAGAGGHFLARGIRRRRRAPRALLVDYGVGSLGSVTVTAAACPACKNVVWIQHVHTEPPKFCAFCGMKFTGVTYGDDDEARKFIVADEP